MSKNVIIVAGPNGSGKTTFVSEYLRNSEISEYISADAIAERLVSRPEDLDSVKLQAGRLFFQEIRRLIETEKDFVVEVTLSGKGFERIISRLKRAGYTVAIVFIFLKSPETCVARVRNRVQAGGHHVPTEDIIRRFYRSKHNFWHTYRYLVDRWHIFYNSAEHFHEVAFGSSNQTTVIDADSFELFMQDIPTESIMRQEEFDYIDIYKETLEFLRIGNRAVKKAQEANRKKGIPNVYDFNGHLYYELPNGELTKEDPFSKKTDANEEKC